MAHTAIIRNAIVSGRRLVGTSHCAAGLPLPRSALTQVARLFLLIGASGAFVFSDPTFLAPLPDPAEVESHRELSR